MKDKRLILRVIVLGVIFVALGSAFYTAYQNDDSPVQIGEVAPDFTLANLAGEQVRLSDYKGKGVFINFWATWCDPCKREMPHMEAQYQVMKEEGIEILAVNITESNVAVNSFKKRLGLSFPILLDRNRSVSNRYGIIPIPSSFFVNKNGIVVSKVEGEMSEQQIEQQLKLIQP